MLRCVRMAPSQRKLSGKIEKTLINSAGNVHIHITNSDAVLCHTHTKRSPFWAPSGPIEITVRHLALDARAHSGIALGLIPFKQHADATPEENHDQEAQRQLSQGCAVRANLLLVNIAVKYRVGPLSVEDSLPAKAGAAKVHLTQRRFATDSKIPIRWKRGGAAQVVFSPLHRIH